MLFFIGPKTNNFLINDTIIVDMDEHTSEGAFLLFLIILISINLLSMVYFCYQFYYSKVCCNANKVSLY